MSIVDSKLSEACIRLHETARVIEDRMGVCEISQSIRKAADLLTRVIQGENDGIN